MPEKDVLIVGAGPTGLTAAVELLRRGVNVTVIDRRDQASSFSRAVAIMPISLELLEPSGVADELLKEGMKFHHVRMYNKDKQLLDLPFQPTRIKHGHDYILGLAQDRTEDILYNKLSELGGKVRFSTELKQFEDRNGKVKAEFADGQPEEFDILIGADGIRSTVREQLGIPYRGYDLPETWSIADVDARNWSNIDAFTVCLLENGKVAVVAPLEPNRLRVISNTEDALEALPLPLDLIKVNRQGQFNISVRQVDHYQKGNVFLAGDAAHCHSPVGGRGMNLGIADAVELARCIAEGDEDTYGLKRHKVGQRTIAGSETARKLATSQSFIKRGLVKSVFSATHHIPFMQKLLSDRFLYG